MFGLFQKNSLSGFGLNISESSIKVLQLKNQGTSLVPQAFYSAPLSPKIISNHSIINQPKLVSMIQGAITKAGKIDTKYVVVSLPEAKSFVRAVKLPQMDLSQVSTAIPFELEQNIPVPLDQVYFDWQVINQSDKEIELLVMATPKDYVDTMLSVLADCKLKPLAFELESQATARALIDKNSDQTSLIVDLSTTETSFILVEKQILEYTSSIPVGGFALTQSIARNLGISDEEAEKLKIKSGLADSKNNSINQAILPILDNIVDEIKNVLRFYDEHYVGHAPIKQILLCGGAAKLAGLVDYISARLNLGGSGSLGEITLANPLVYFGHNSAQVETFDSLEYATAIGLAMRATEFKVDWQI